MRPLSEPAARIASQNFSRKYIAIGRIVNHWDDIVGKKLAHKAHPVKIHYRKPKKKGDQASATLEIAAASADATLLHYQKDLILERINQVFGERWITCIRFVATPANTVSGFRKKRASPLTIQEKKALSGVVDTVADDQIRQRLENLGQAIFTHEK